MADASLRQAQDTQRPDSLVNTAVAVQAPHDIETEQAVLGAILLNNDAFERVSAFLEPQCFYEPIHGKLYEIMRSMITAGRAVTPVTIRAHLEPDMEIGLGVSLGQYVARLAAEGATVFHTYDYGRVIVDYSTRRGLISVAEDIMANAYAPEADHDANAQIELAEQSIYALAEHKRFGGGFKSFEQAVTTAVDRASDAFQRNGALAGISTGLVDLDHMMGGMEPSSLLILAGRPGMGKTALATNIAYSAANGGSVVGFFSLEMSTEQLATRVIAERSDVASNKFRRGAATEQEMVSFIDAGARLKSLPLHIDETGAITLGQLAARARRLKRQKGLDLLVVDYIQLMRGSSRKANENRVQEVTEISSGLKAIAKELNVPVLALSQLSRQVENREDKRPHLADLRESGSIEQDADVVIFIYREEYYHQMRRPPESDGEAFAEWMAQGAKVGGKAEVIIAKNRHGPQGTVELQFQGEITRFSSMARNGTSGLGERMSP